ncbi:phenylacetate--CoA ligase family protein [Lentzea sp. BCCO 10_0856]|uniref:Phenylacetate--CoA ligase family protein n=1 Tax=Lentzea miocenica TaxID=3095431 RepID=A0ABU4SZ21_9PSEU|nr:phenylacetate--CoA ligase family protein [Lentzea sp. BCCO 10_0856]MDX8031151.1 phenylacetate--CoA ligase family protein [Lentzea sp. BCCO 10_0856]
MSVLDLVCYARTHSPFYKDLYDGIDPSAPLSGLPVIDQAAFWTANTVRDNQVLTRAHTDGLIFKTGGTTKAPRVSFYTNEEWDAMCRTYADTLPAAGLRHGDRIANLFAAGELYSSFIFALNSLQRSPIDLVQLPITGSAPVEFTLTTMQDFDATVVAGFPTTLCRLASHVVAEAGSLPLVRLILFSGEALYDDQRALLSEAFPQAEFRSFVYGSVDGGIIGTAVLGSDDPRVFRSFVDSSVLEIVDAETGELITSPGRPGRLLQTDLTRRLQPMIRYPVGDLAEWVDVEDGIFRLLGRADEGARVGPVTLHLDHLRAAVDRAGVVHNGVQIVIRRVDARDQLVLRIAGAAQDFDAVRAEVYVISPRFELQVGRGTVAPLAVEWVPALEVNPRSGKTVRLIDERPC